MKAADRRGAQWRVENELRVRLALTEGTQTTRADLHLLKLPVVENGHLLDVGLPRTLGPNIGVADVMSKGRRLATNITLGHEPPLNHR